MVHTTGGLNLKRCYLSTQLTKKWARDNLMTNNISIKLSMTLGMLPPAVRLLSIALPQLQRLQLEPMGLKTTQYINVNVDSLNSHLREINCFVCLFIGHSYQSRATRE